MCVAARRVGGFERFVGERDVVVDGEEVVVSTWSGGGFEGVCGGCEGVFRGFGGCLTSLVRGCVLPVWDKTISGERGVGVSQRMRQGPRSLPGISRHDATAA